MVGDVEMNHGVEPTIDWCLVGIWDVRKDLHSELKPRCLAWVTVGDVETGHGVDHAIDWRLVSIWNIGNGLFSELALGLSLTLE